MGKQTYAQYKRQEQIRQGIIEDPRITRARMDRRQQIKENIVGRKPQVINQNGQRVVVSGKQGLLNRRYVPERRRMPGRPLVSREGGAKIVGFISGRQPPVPRSKGYATRGRPKGSFYKYTIPGVGPVDVFTHRKWLRNQQRLLAAKLQAQNPDLTYNQAIVQVRRNTSPESIQTRPNPQQTQNIQPQAVQTQIEEHYEHPQTLQAPIPQPPVDDGWGLLRIKSPLTMTAPNTPVDPIANAQRPVGNKFTSYYSEPDFVSGKQVMKQRPNIGGFGLW